MLSVGCFSAAAPVVLEEMKAACPVEGMFLGSEDAKAPWNLEVPSTVASAAAAVCSSNSKGMSRQAMLQLLNTCGVSLAAQKLALDILMKLVTREAEKFDDILFSGVVSSLVESKGCLLEYFMNKYFGMSQMNAAELQAFFTPSTPLQKGVLERDKLLVALFIDSTTQPVLPNSDWRNCDTLLFPVLERDDQSSEDEKENGTCCKADALDAPIEAPENGVISEGLSPMIQTAARVRDTDTNNSKAGGEKKKPGEDDENDVEEDDDQENEPGGGESGGDEEGESDEPDQGGNEEEEGEEEEEENEEEEDEDDDNAQQQQQQPPLNLNNINNNGGEFDEDDEENPENDGGVEQEDDEGDGDGADEEEEEDEADLEAAPPKKKQKK